MLVDHAVESACWSVHDDPAAQAFSHWDLVCEAVLFASKLHLEIDSPYANAFPGDHYRLLAGLLACLDKRSSVQSIVDIGTHFGTGTRVMLDYAPKAAVHTFDILPYTAYPRTYLRGDDFVSEGGRLTQYLNDLSQDDVFKKCELLFIDADFIMCDGPKDGQFERAFITKLASLPFTKKPRFLFLDDIRFPGEMPLWRKIQSPKADLVSFGHFTGSGLVDISEGLVLETP